MTDIAVRLAGPDDYEAAGALREAAYSHDYEISDHYRESLRDTAPRDGRQVWVAVERHTGRLLGTVVTPVPGGHISDLGQDRELDFRLLAVDPAARRRGIGRLLIEHVIALAAERGDERVVMNSGAQMTGAHQLYYSMGFSRLVERETRTVPGQSRPLLAFGYDLARHEAADGARF